MENQTKVKQLESRITGGEIRNFVDPRFVRGLGYGRICLNGSIEQSEQDNEEWTISELK